MCARIETSSFLEQHRPAWCCWSLITDQVSRAGCSSGLYLCLSYFTTHLQVLFLRLGASERRSASFVQRKDPSLPISRHRPGAAASLHASGPRPLPEAPPPAPEAPPPAPKARRPRVNQLICARHGRGGARSCGVPVRRCRLSPLRLFPPPGPFRRPPWAAAPGAAPARQVRARLRGNRWGGSGWGCEEQRVPFPAWEGELRGCGGTREQAPAHRAPPGHTAAGRGAGSGPGRYLSWAPAGLLLGNGGHLSVCCI